MAKRTPKIDIESAEQYSFLLNEFSQFKNTQSHLVSDIQATFKLSQSTILTDIATIKQMQTTTAQDIIDIKNNIMGIKQVLFERRDGKDSICGSIDSHEQKIKSLENHNKQNSLQSWELKKAIPIALIVAAVNLLFFFLFYKG